MMRFFYSILLIAVCSLPLQARNIPYDINRDYDVNISDVTDLIDLLLNGNASSNMAADVNGNGYVNIADVIDLIDILLRGDAIIYTYPEELKKVQFYTNSALQIGAWRTTMAMGDWTRNNGGGSYWNVSYWYPVMGQVTIPYHWWFVGAYGACFGLWEPIDDNLIDIYEQASKVNNYAFAGVAKVIRAYGFMAMTDLYGEMPYTEVTKGCGTGGLYRFLPEDAPLPKYDDGKTIFLGCINDIEEAIDLLEKAKTQDPSLPTLDSDYNDIWGSGDIWNHGDIDKWIKLAYFFKARWLNKLIKKAPGNYKYGRYDADEILACLDKAMQSNADNTIMEHFDNNTPVHDDLGWDEPVDYSPMFSVCGMNSGYMVTKMLYDNLTNFGGYGVEDPRADHIIPWAHSLKGYDSLPSIKWLGDWRRSLGVDMASDINSQGGPLRANYDIDNSRWYIDWYWFNSDRLGDTVYVECTSDSKGYFGNPSILYCRAGSGQFQSAESGSFYTRVSSPTYIGTYAECCFIRAEVLLKKGNLTGAYNAYKAGIKASCELMNEKLQVWIDEDPSLADCPSFTPITQAAIDNFLNNGIGSQDQLTMGHILTQKRIALMFSYEIWNDMRRYDFNPNLFFGWSIPAYHYKVVAAMQAIPEGKQYRRWRQCSHEYYYNAENLQAIGYQVPGARMTDGEGNEVNWNMQDDTWTIPVWWDSYQD
jgi:tetratricopeptide (TPR) repeat protein